MEDCKSGILAIINPASARGRKADIANALRDAAKASNLDIDIAHTRDKGDASRFARDFALQSSPTSGGRIIACGGDGTIHEVINGIMAAPVSSRPTLAVIPQGTGNDFAYAAGIPTDHDAAIDLALNAPPRPVDVGAITLPTDPARQLFFCNCVGTLLDGAINMESHRLTKPRGFLLYLTAAIRSMIHHYRPANLAIDADGRQTNQPAILLSIANAPRTGGGFFLAPDARLDDGTLTITTIAPMSRPRMFMLLPRVINKTIARSQFVTHTRAQSVTITLDKPTPIQVDGELIATPEDNLTQFTLQCLPGALRVAAPPVES